MQEYIELLAMLPIIAICYQLYSYAISSPDATRQRRSRKLGIAYMTLGITALIARNPPLVFLGLVLIMMGFRLIAKGLDRLDKKIFIDRYDGLNNGSEPDGKGKGD